MGEVDGRANVTPIFIAYACVGWFLAGLGAVLPELGDAVGRLSDLYPLLPGLVLCTWGVVLIRRHRGAHAVRPHSAELIAGSAVLALGSVGVGVTGWSPFSLAAATICALALTALIRTIPAALSASRPVDSGKLLMRANAWSSLGSVAAPAVIGAAIATSLGWRIGLSVPLMVAAVAVAAMLRPTTTTNAAAAPHQAPLPAHPTHQVLAPIADWWLAWLTLTVCIVVEFCFSYFAATFLHEELGLSTAWAAVGAAAWGVGMTAGRFALSGPRQPRSIMPSLAVIGVGFAMFWAVRQPVIAFAGILVAGLGAAPLYPMRLQVLLDRFPASADQASARASVASGAALLGAPALMVAIRSVSDVRTAYLAVPVLLVVAAALGWTGAPKLAVRRSSA